MSAPSTSAASAVGPSEKRLTLIATILGSSIAILDTSVVSVALPSIQRDLGGGLAGQQWVSNAYLLTLGSLILLGGSLGDIFGERRIFALGVGGFGAASLLCAVAPTIGLLVAFRALQGIAGRAVDAQLAGGDRRDLSRPANAARRSAPGRPGARSPGRSARWSRGRS